MENEIKFAKEKYGCIELNRLRHRHRKWQCHCHLNRHLHRHQMGIGGMQLHTEANAMHRCDTCKEHLRAYSSNLSKEHLRACRSWNLRFHFFRLGRCAIWKFYKEKMNMRTWEQYQNGGNWQTLWIHDSRDGS
jgi:hypothetical protein